MLAVSTAKRKGGREREGGKKGEGNRKGREGMYRNMRDGERKCG